MTELVPLRRKNAYGGPGPFRVPADHVPAIPVPKGGSCCKNCMFVDAARHECKNEYYIEWNGGPALPPLPLDEICSDWYDWPGSSLLAHNPRRAEHHHYVWKTNQRGEVIGQSIDGPYPLKDALARATTEARRSGLDRMVSLGHDPKAGSFKIVAAYHARTGKKFGVE